MNRSKTSLSSRPVSRIDSGDETARGRSACERTSPTCVPPPRDQTPACAQGRGVVNECGRTNGPSATNKSVNNLPRNGGPDRSSTIFNIMKNTSDQQADSSSVCLTDKLTRDSFCRSNQRFPQYENPAPLCGDSIRKAGCVPPTNNPYKHKTSCGHSAYGSATCSKNYYTHQLGCHHAASNSKPPLCDVKIRNECVPITSNENWSIHQTGCHHAAYNKKRPLGGAERVNVCAHATSNKTHRIDQTTNTDATVCTHQASQCRDNKEKNCCTNHFTSSTHACSDDSNNESGHGCERFTQNHRCPKRKKKKVPTATLR